MKHLFKRFTNIGAHPSEDGDSRLRRIIFIWASLANIPSYGIYSALYSFFGAPLVGFIMLVFMAISWTNLTVFGSTGRGFAPFLLLLTISPMIASCANLRI